MVPLLLVPAICAAQPAELTPVGILADDAVLAARASLPGAGQDAPFALVLQHPDGREETLGGTVVAAAVNDEGTAYAWASGTTLTVVSAGRGTERLPLGKTPDSVHLIEDRAYVVHDDRLVPVKGGRPLLLICNGAVGRACVPEELVPGWLRRETVDLGQRVIQDGERFVPLPDGRRAAVHGQVPYTWTGAGGGSRAWLLDGRELRVPDGVARRLWIAPDRTWAVVPRGANLARIDLASGDVRPPTQRGSPVALWASPDGSLALTADDTRTPTLWDVASGQPIPSPAGLEGVFQTSPPEWRRDDQSPTGWTWSAGTRRSAEPCATVHGRAFCLERATGGTWLVHEDGTGDPRPLPHGARAHLTGSDAGLAVWTRQPGSVSLWFPWEGQRLGDPLRLDTPADAFDIASDLLIAWDPARRQVASRGLASRASELPALSRPAVTVPDVRRSTRDSPHLLVLAVDITGSFREVVEIRDALAAVVDRVGPDAVAVVAFYHRYARVLAPLGSPSASLEAALQALDVPCKPHLPSRTRGAEGPCDPDAHWELADEAGSDPSVGLRGALALLGPRKGRRSILLVHDGITGPPLSGETRWIAGPEMPEPTLFGPVHRSRDAVLDAWRALQRQAEDAGIDVRTVHFTGGLEQDCLPGGPRCETAADLAELDAVITGAIPP